MLWNPHSYVGVLQHPVTARPRGGRVMSILVYLFIYIHKEVIMSEVHVPEWVLKSAEEAEIRSRANDNVNVAKTKEVYHG